MEQQEVVVFRYYHRRRSLDMLRKINCKENRKGKSEGVMGVSYSDSIWSSTPSLSVFSSLFSSFCADTMLKPPALWNNGLGKGSVEGALLESSLCS